MSGRWWRAYSRARHDPKLLKLSDRDFRWWFNFVCVAADSDGVMPSHADLAVEFRASGATVTKALDALVAAGLLDHDETGIHPHNWNGLQYKSDVSNERVKRFRERHRNDECNVTETPSESEADTEADTEQTKANALEGAGAQKPKRKTALPKDWEATEEQLAYATSQGCADPIDTAERFRLHHLSKGTVGADWNLGFQYWCRNEKKFKGGGAGGENASDRRAREVQEAIERSKMQ